MHDLLQLAIQARMPLVLATTNDTFSFPDVINTLCGNKPKKFDDALAQALTQKNHAPNVSTKDQTLWHNCKGQSLLKPTSKRLADLDVLYENLVACGSTLILVNATNPPEVVFETGEVPVPRSIIRTILRAAVSKEDAENLLPVVGGLTGRETAELMRLTQARDEEITVEGMMKTRRGWFRSSQGLELVDPTQSFYSPPPFLTAAVEHHSKFFMAEDIDPRLRPRGLLMDGPPGTGKTEAAKWIANQWHVPLFRMTASMLNKYLGESENNMRDALQRVDALAPCVLLIDEAEKLFTTGHAEMGSSGAMTRMASLLLWWLAEHRTRVFTVMTTNKSSIIPPELFREGRIDDTLMFQLLTQDQAVGMAEAYAGTFDLDAELREEVVKLASEKFPKNDNVSPAVVKSETHAAIRKLTVDKT